MPKLTHELTPERDDEIARRGKVARAKLPPPNTTETTHSTARGAVKAAARLGLPNAKISAVETTHGWVGVVLLGEDQGWMIPTVTGHGCRVGRREQP
jgi:hypothetical protein